MIEAEIDRKLKDAKRSLGDALDLCARFTRRNSTSRKVPALKKTRRDIGRLMDAFNSVRGLRDMAGMEDPDLITEDERAMQARQKRKEERAKQREAAAK